MTGPREQLHEIGQRITRGLAEEIVEEIRSSPRTPYDPLEAPHLRDAFHVRPSAEGHDIIATVRHWGYVEYGHRTRHSPSHPSRWVPAQPYLRPAIGAVLARQRREST